MFIKIANNRKKIIDTALAAGYRPKRVSPERSTLVSNFIRVENNVVSNISVSYRKKDPAVKIQHFHKNGKREEIERILLSKRTWEELVSHLRPQLSMTETDRKAYNARNRSGDGAGPREDAIA
ncbi:MAG: hypothetical protein H9W81_08320 [Enterococcus sp.]|nr:hypothetical protein [Enterococcus sp.]